MSAPRGDLLLGKIAVREGLITREQLFDCLQAQERNPSRSIGSIMVSRGYLRNEDVDRLVELQKREFDKASAPASGSAPRRSLLIGRILSERGLATDYQVNEALRLQGRMSELGINPVPTLGEILLRRGYLSREALETALQLQNLQLYTCPECSAPIDVDRDAAAEEDYACAACGAEVPFLFAYMASAVKDALDEASKAHDVELPDEVRRAATDSAKNFGKYILLKEIGRGGAGIVYKAWRRETNAIVALKILPHESDTAAGVKTPFGDVEDVKRFYMEIRAHSELKHPNIVPVDDFGTVENHFYYTMKYIEGVTLDGVVREGIDERAFQTTIITTRPELADSGRKDTARIVKGKGMPLRKALSIIRELSLAVHYAHGLGVYHRDIKPANVIIDKEAKPWLMDFGLAKVTKIGDSAYVKGVIMGTPYYMPPEQAIGDMEQVDDHSDVYSLGAVLYEMVSGYCPYTGKTPDEVLNLLPHTAPETLRTYVPDLPEPVLQIIDKCMAGSKGRRYASAADLAEDLQNFLDDKPLNDEPKGAKPRSVWNKLRGLFGSKE